jgi:toxin ParE1/3/4
MRLRYARRALSDLDAIAEYFVPLNPRAAKCVRAAIQAALLNVLGHPRMGRRQTLERVRKVSVRKYNYFIYYLLDEDAGEIVVLAIPHGARELAFFNE